MSAELARRWWLIALRGTTALVFGLALLLLPRPMMASLVLLCAGYLAADGVFAVLAGMGAWRRGEHWPMLIVEGGINLAAAAGVLVWPAVAAVPLVTAAGAWAVITGAVLLAAARRVAPSHGGWLLVAAATISAAWGGIAALAPRWSTVAPPTLALWLVAYAWLFGALLLGLAACLQRHHRAAVFE